MTTKGWMIPVLLLATLACAGWLAAPWADAGYHRTPAPAPREGAKPAGDEASVSILAPKDGEVLTSAPVSVQYTYVKGRRGDHVHVYLDGNNRGVSGASPLQLKEVKKGSHTLELRAAARDHDEFGPRVAVAFELR